VFVKLGILTETPASENYGHTCRDTLGAYFPRDLLESITHFLPRRRTLPVGIQDCASLLATLPAAGFFSIGPDLSGPEYTPGSQRKTLLPCHRDDITLEGSLADGPVTLINAEWGFSVILCVLSGFGNDPCRNALEKQIVLGRKGVKTTRWRTR